MQSLVVDINLPRDRYLTIYHTYVRQVRAIARDGQSVRFPISVLQPFVTTEGVHGTFLLRFDESNKFKGIERL